MSTAVETVKIFMDTLKNYSQDSAPVGRVALEDAVRRSSLFSSLEEAVGLLAKMLADEDGIYTDTDTKLQKITGMVIGADNDFTADTGAITGANAGGDTVKNAQSIVPEDEDLSTAELPTPGSTTPITYTGNDGKSFTFYVKWPNSLTEAIDCVTEGDAEVSERIKDSNYHIDLDTLDPDGYYEISVGEFSDGSPINISSPTYGEMKSSIQTALKGLNKYWLREAAKLNYDSLGLALDGQTIEIGFGAGSEYESASAITTSLRDDGRPDNYIFLTLSLSSFGRLDSTDPNGRVVHRFDSDTSEPSDLYLDRVIAHEMVHAVMSATGTIKRDMPQFFTEGIADLVQGDDDYNSEQTEKVVTLANDTETLIDALSFAEGTGSSYAYPAGDMFMRFIAQQGLNVTQFVGDSASSETFSYETNSAVITNYDENDTINYNKDLKAFSLTDLLDDFVVAGNETSFPSEETQMLIVRDVRGKVISMNTPSGMMYAFMASNSTEVDGRNINGGSNNQVLFGSNYENDIIRAGNGENYLWGGKAGNDEIFGGVNKDVFAYEFLDGHDVFQNVESQDAIKLNLALNQIVGAQLNDSGCYLAFSDGGSLLINGTPSSFTVNVDDSDKTYQANYETKTWTETTGA